MTRRERIWHIIAGKNSGRCGFWLGNPDRASWRRYKRHFNMASSEAIRQKLGDDIRWICPQFLGSTYADVEHMDMFLPSIAKASHGQSGPFADCESVSAVRSFKWPDARQLRFEDTIARLRKAGSTYRLSGFWTCFYHNCMDLFGMESYMMKMITHPEVVHAVTDRVCEFYHEANERFFAAAGDLVDGFFFGNDFGTQSTLICGPDQFEAFIMPWFRKFTRQGHEHGLQVILHSCGAIHSVIRKLIDAGVDCLHPLQAKANHMDAETLAKDFKGEIAFMGGIDTQDLLVNAEPHEVKKEVARIKRVLGPNLIISPSHEALLPDVPPENVTAMAEAAAEEC